MTRRGSKAPARGPILVQTEQSDSPIPLDSGDVPAVETTFIATGGLDLDALNDPDDEQVTVVYNGDADTYRFAGVKFSQRRPTLVSKALAEVLLSKPSVGFAVVATPLHEE